ncbi:hypothetical protein ACVXSW_004638, partial [Vibrio parahaemolyticus]
IHNAALSGEQRRPLNLKYCVVNTKIEANQKCRALGIRLKCFVISVASTCAQTDYLERLLQTQTFYTAALLDFLVNSRA